MRTVRRTAKNLFLHYEPLECWRWVAFWMAAHGDDTKSWIGVKILDLTKPIGMYVYHRRHNKPTRLKCAGNMSPPLFPHLQVLLFVCITSHWCIIVIIVCMSHGPNLDNGSNGFGLESSEKWGGGVLFGRLPNFELTTWQESDTTLEDCILRNLCWNVFLFLIKKGTHIQCYCM